MVLFLYNLTAPLHTFFVCLSYLSCLIASVAMSGIVNARMEGSLEIFGQQLIDRARSKCFLEGIATPSAQLQQILEPLRSAYKKGKVKGLLNAVEIGIGQEAILRSKGEPSDEFKRSILDAIRHM